MLVVRLSTTVCWHRTDQLAAPKAPLYCDGPHSDLCLACVRISGTSLASGRSYATEFDRISHGHSLLRSTHPVEPRRDRFQVTTHTRMPEIYACAPVHPPLRALVTPGLVATSAIKRHHRSPHNTSIGPELCILYRIASREKGTFSSSGEPTEEPKNRRKSDEDGHLQDRTHKRHMHNRPSGCVLARANLEKKIRLLGWVLQYHCLM